MRVVSFVLLMVAGLARAQEPPLPSGQIVEKVPCVASPTQTYALYLPSAYSRDHSWPVILAFDAGGRGRAPVAQFQAAAEKFGYIVAGSYNSRNGPIDISFAAAKAVLDDVTTRFNVDHKRLYAAGLSGGARFALELALTTNKFAGVFASSAGFLRPDPPNALPFKVFGSAGTDDFNNLEMRRLDRFLTSSHRVAVFNGTHTWLPSDLAIAAVSWMQTGVIQDDRVLKAPTNREQEQQAAEEKLTAEIYRLIEKVENPPAHDAAMERLRQRLSALSLQAGANQDSEERQLARRVIRGMLASSGAVQDAAFREFAAQLRQSNPRD